MARPSRSKLLDKVMKLRPMAFAYKAGYRDGSGELSTGDQYGFIAQDVERPFPLLVADHPIEKVGRGGRTVTKTIKAIHYPGLVALLVAAIQEQQRTIEALLPAAPPKRRRRPAD